MFDPNQELPDLQQQTADAQRQRAYADMLRKRAYDTEVPQGRMVGKQYINPHWTQALSPIIGQLVAGWAGNKANEAEQANSRGVAEATDSWQSSLPRAVAAIPGRGELPGPRAEAGSPELEAVAPVPARLPDRDSILKATIAGLKIPGNKDAAMLWNKGMGEDLAREDNQAQKAADLQARMVARKDELDAKLEVAREKLATDEAKGIRDDETKRYVAELMAESRRLATAMTGTIASNKLDAPKTAKPIPNAVHKDLAEKEATLTTMDEMNSSFKPSYAGTGGLTKTITGTYLPGANTDAAEWWKNYRKQAQLAERHAMFGSALTASEKSAWRGADIEPYMNPKLVAKNLATRAELSKKIYEKTRTQYSREGHNVDEAFPSLGGASAAPKPPPGLQLPPGATYVGPAN